MEAMMTKMLGHCGHMELLKPHQHPSRFVSFPFMIFRLSSFLLSPKVLILFFLVIFVLFSPLSFVGKVLQHEKCIVSHSPSCFGLTIATELGRGGRSRRCCVTVTSCRWLYYSTPKKKRVSCVVKSFLKVSLFCFVVLLFYVGLTDHAS